MRAASEQDAGAAVSIYGWKDVRLELGRWRGKPPKGLRKDVPAYSSDIELSIHIARHVAQRTGGELKISIDHQAIDVWFEDATGYRASFESSNNLAKLSGMIFSQSIAALKRPATQRRGEMK